MKNENLIWDEIRIVNWVDIDSLIPKMLAFVHLRSTRHASGDHFDLLFTAFVPDATISNKRLKENFEAKKIAPWEDFLKRRSLKACEMDLTAVQSAGLVQLVCY